MSRPKQITSVTTILLLSLSLAGTSALLAVALFTSVAEAKPASVLLQEGLYAEEIEGNLDAAIKIYEQVVAEAKATEQTAAQAMYRIGMCYLKKGEKDKAAERFAEVLSRFPEQEDLVAKAQEQLEKIAPPTQEAELPPEVMMYIVGLHMESYARAQSLNIRANTRVYGVDDEFNLYTGGFAVIKNKTGQTWTGEVPVASFSYSNLDVYNEQGQKQKARMVRRRAGRGGRYMLFWTLDRPIEPGEMRTIGWRVKGTEKLPQEGPRGSFCYSLNMNNHYGPEVLENFFLVIPFNVAIKERSKDYISHERIGIFDIYQWQSRVPADTVNTVNVVLAPRAVAPAEEFGAVIERVIYQGGSPHDCLIDFETGKLYRVPEPLRGPNVRDEQILEWIKLTGVDAAGDTAGSTSGPQGSQGLQGFPDDMVATPAPGGWDAGVDVLVAMTQALAPTGKARMFVKGELPETYYFKTREGNMGVLQILGFMEGEPRGVKFRYKMLQEKGQTVALGAERSDSNGKKLFTIFVTCGTTCDAIEEALEKGDVETAKVLSEQVTKLLPEGQILARGTAVESAAEMLVNQFGLFCEALKNNDIDRARTLMAAMQRLGGHSYEMFERLSEPSQAAGGGRGDPAKAVEFMPALYALFQGAYKAVDGNDFGTALMLTRKLLEQRSSFEAAVRGTAAQAGVEGGFETVEMLADALEKKDAARARSLLEGLNSMGPALQDAIEKEAKRQQKLAAGFGPVIERMIGEDSTVLDFETGKVFGIPHMLRDKPEEVGLRWVVDNGIDVGADQELIGLDMAGEKLAPQAWKRISAAELMAIVQNANTVKGWAIMPHSGQYPPTYAFRTREGGIGILQILDVIAEGTKIRYKMVSKDAPPAEAVDPNSVKKWKMGGLEEMAAEHNRRAADNLAHAGWDLRKAAEAERHLRKVAEAERAGDLRKSEIFARAEEMFKKALQTDPTNASALRGLAVTYMEGKKYDEAIKYYEMWLKIEPDNTDAKEGLKRAKSPIDLSTPEATIKSFVNAVYNGNLEAAKACVSKEGADYDEFMETLATESNHPFQAMIKAMDASIPIEITGKDITKDRCKIEWYFTLGRVYYIGDTKIKKGTHQEFSSYLTLVGDKWLIRDI